MRRKSIFLFVPVILIIFIAALFTHNGAGAVPSFVNVVVRVANPLLSLLARSPGERRSGALHSIKSDHVEPHERVLSGVREREPDIIAENPDELGTSIIPNNGATSGGQTIGSPLLDESTPSAAGTPLAELLSVPQVVAINPIGGAIFNLGPSLIPSVPIFIGGPGTSIPDVGQGSLPLVSLPSNTTPVTIPSTIPIPESPTWIMMFFGLIVIGLTGRTRKCTCNTRVG